MSTGHGLVRCAVEEKLGPELALELDMFLADPSKWPKAIFDGWKLPPGPMPTRFRSWGAVKLGLEWLRSRDIAVSKLQMARHYREHVPIVPYGPSDFVDKALSDPPAGRAIVPTNLITYQEVYQKGLKVGSKALDLLLARVEEIEHAGGTVPQDLLLKLADLGTKLATSQASILARGLDLAREKDDEIEGFRSGSAPLPSERINGTRVRVIEGEARPVVDRGPADRQHYSKRARQEGSPTLPSP